MLEIMDWRQQHLCSFMPRTLKLEDISLYIILHDFIYNYLSYAYMSSY